MSHKNEEILNENEEKVNNISDENLGTQEQYTFVRETIKKRPPFFVRFFIRVIQVLCMGAIFGLGFCLVLFVFGKDIRDLFGGEDEVGTIISTQEGETPTKADIDSDLIIKLEEVINSKLVNRSEESRVVK